MPSLNFYDLAGFRLAYTEMTFVGKLLTAFTGFFIAVIIAEAFKKRREGKELA